MKELIQLIKERAIIDAKIRAHRVISIRQYFVMLKEEHLDKEFLHLVDEMERRLASVNYCQAEFDELLEEIEAKLDI